ncbi:hypothetical protein BH09BAC5_BH09BAC5_25140 [soil metagenome]
MKTSIKIAVAALVIASFGFEGCKKGPNDPFMSIHTRKGRVVGDWKVSAGSGTDSQTSPTSSSSWTFDGTTYSQTSGSSTTTSNLTLTMSFAKDGTYKTVTTATAVGYSDVTTESGTWNFTGKIGDDKNKDHIVMKTLSNVDVTTIGSSSSTSTNTYTGDDAPTSLMYLDELKNKEIIMTYDGTSANGSSTSTSKGSWTLTPQ